MNNVKSIYMKRNIIKSLIKWKNKTDRKPLLLTGVRQCGKTYILKEFGNTYFEDCAYLNFENNPNLKFIFEQDFDVKRIIKEIESIVIQKSIVQGKTLLILDEIQECPSAITSLKYFCENMPKLHLVCAGSLLGVKIKQNNISFPVGKVEHIQMYPMSFDEFVCADNGEKYIKALNEISLDKPLSELYTIPLEKYLKQYFIVGGMPEVVLSWVNKHDYNEIDELQENIIYDYSNDFSKHAPLTEIPKLGWIWDSIPKQLAKENNKFIFSHVKEGKRSNDLENALQWLENAGLVYCPQKVSNPEAPLSFSSDATYFKVYMSDIGLLRKRSNLSYKSILAENELFSSFKGAIAENYINNELNANKITPYFYRSGNIAEIDFLIEKDNIIIPIEVKSADNTRAKSLSTYIKRYSPKYAFKMSLKNIASNTVGNTELKSIPLYLAWKLFRDINNI